MYVLTKTNDHNSFATCTNNGNEDINIIVKIFFMNP